LAVFGNEETSQFAGQHEIILDKPFFDKGALVGRHHFIQATSKAVSKDFCHQLSKVVHKADGPKIMLGVCLA
jgi:hypothetical protein